MRYAIRRTKRFKNDVKRLQRSGKSVEKLLLLINKIARGEELPKSCRDHQLKGILKDKRDCHVEDDWILLYSIDDNEVILYRTGSHSQLFR